MSEDRGERVITKKEFNDGVEKEIELIEKDNFESDEDYDAYLKSINYGGSTNGVRDDYSSTASALKVFSGITIAVATICGIILWAIIGGLGFIYFLACVMGGVLSGLLLIGFGEVISTLRRIERNTNSGS